MAAPAVFIVSMYSADRPVCDFGTNSRSSVTDSGLKLTRDQVLPEGRQHVAGPARDLHTQRIKADKLHRVPHDIGPKTGAGCENNRVVDAGLDRPDPATGRSISIQFLDRYEFIEQAIVEHQTQPVFRAGIRHPDKTLACRIDFAQFCRRARNKAFKTMAVGFEINPTVDQQFQIWKILRQFRSGITVRLSDLVKEQEQPGRGPTEKTNILSLDGGHQACHLFFPVGDLCQIVRRKGTSAEPPGQVCRHDSRQVSAADTLGFLNKIRAASQHEGLASENPALGPVAEMMANQVQSGDGVRRHHLMGAGNIFCAPGRGARGDSEEWNRTGPADAPQIRERFLPVFFVEILVAAQRHALLILGDAADIAEIMVPSKFRTRCPTDQSEQLALLDIGGVHTRELPQATARIQTGNRRGIQHLRA